MFRERLPSARLRAIPASAAALLAGALVLGHGLSSLEGPDQWTASRRDRLIGRAALRFINVLAERKTLAFFVHPDVHLLEARANVLDRLGYLRPHLVRTNLLREVGDPASAGSTELGAIEKSRDAGGGRLGVIGWAIVPGSHRPADAVLLTYDDSQGEPVIFNFGDLGFRRDGVDAPLDDPLSAQCGWVKAFDPRRLPAGVKIVKAWLYDAEQGRAFRLKGEVNLHP
jgi:hypothetical protein